jgi:hypothetical protein
MFGLYIFVLAGLPFMSHLINAWLAIRCLLSTVMDPSTPHGDIIDLLLSGGLATIFYRLFTRKARRFKKADELLILAIESVREIERLVKEDMPDKAVEFCDFVAGQTLPAVLAKLQGFLMGKLPAKVEPEIATAKALVKEYRDLLDQNPSRAMGELKVLVEVRSALAYARSVLSAAYLEWA